MNDKALFTLVIATVRAQLALDPALSGCTVARSYQATQQGATTTPAIYLFKVGDKRYGTPRRFDVWNGVTSLHDTQEVQQYETTLQFSAMVPQVPQVPLTESDILNMVSGIMQSDTTIAAFQAAGVGLQRITDVRNPYIVDDHSRYEAVPTFDIVLTHKRTRLTTTPPVVKYELITGRV